MAILFSVDEILQMAIEIERNGARFYKKAAGTAAKELKKLLLDLAAQELQHEKTFAEMRTGLSEKEKKSPGPGPQEESQAYLQAWADGHVFDIRVDPSQKLSGKETIEEILYTAIGIEKDSIVFYLGMKESVPERLGKAGVDRIIKEEMSHMTSLSRQLGTLRHQAL